VVCKKSSEQGGNRPFIHCVRIVHIKIGWYSLHPKINAILEFKICPTEDGPVWIHKLEIV
jgi:hypothetical protein